MNPEDPFLQNDLGLVYMAKNSLENAENHFKKAIDIKPDYAPAKNTNLGVVYLAQEKWAIAVFKELTGDLLYATPHYPLTNLGWAYYNKQQYEIEKYYREAIGYDANYSPALRGLGRTQWPWAASMRRLHFMKRRSPSLLGLSMPILTLAEPTAGPVITIKPCRF